MNSNYVEPKHRFNYKNIERGLHYRKFFYILYENIIGGIYMNINSFIKMGPEYVAWSSSITKGEVDLIETSGSGSTRKVNNYKVVVKDLFDMLLFRCHGLGVYIKNQIEGMSEDEVQNYFHETAPTIELEGYTVMLEAGRYYVICPIDEVKKLLKISRRSSTWDCVVPSETKLDVDTLTTVLEKMISMSIIKVGTRDLEDKDVSGAGAVITKAIIDKKEELIYFWLDASLVDFITPNNKYNAKFLSDSFVLGSEYCKNFHSYISYYADVFKRKNWSGGRPYNYSSIETVAKFMGVRYSPDIRDYCKETKEYSRTNVVQFVKNYTKEINEKTRLKELYGPLNYEIIRDGKRGKVKGFRFYFEEV